MSNSAAADADRLKELTDRLDCLTEDDLALLTKTTPVTVESWRKRGVGPAYVLVGNRFLYPRSAVAKFIESNVRQRGVPLRAPSLL